MNQFILVRALRNIKRIPGRSIMTGGILFVIITLVLVGLTVNAGTKISIREARKSLGNKAVLQSGIEGVQQKNGEDMNSAISSLADLTDDTADKLTASELIEGYDYLIYAFADSDIDSLKIDSLSMTGSGGSTSPPAQLEFRLVGNSALERMEDFKGGTKKLAEGRGYTEQEVEEGMPVAVIDKRVADLNKLKVGSEFELTMYRKEKSAVTPLKLEVIGIYEDFGKDENVFTGMDVYLRGNVIHMPYTTLQKMVTENNYRPEGFLSTVYYYLHDPLDIDKLRDEAEKAGIDMTKFNLELSDNSFTKITAPMNKLSDFAGTGVIAIMITGAFIMVLLMTIIIRERKTEVGILRALGASRAVIAIQFACESLLLCSAAIILGLIIGSAVSQSVAEQFLRKEISVKEKQETQNNVMKSFDEILNPNSSPGMLDDIHIETGLVQIAQLVITGLAICLCGSIVSIYWIMKYEPMKMLANRT